MRNQDGPRSVGDLYDWPVIACEPARADIEDAPCPICDEPRARPVFEVGGVASPVVQCPRCGLGRFLPIPDAEQVKGFYPDEYYGEPGAKFQPLIERIVRFVSDRHVGFLCHGLRPGARVLDVGCGRGVILGPLADRGFQVHGVEVSHAAARGADPRAEIRISPRLSDANYPDAFFDEVVIWHVLEHLADPRETLETIHRILRPGGRLVVAVPNFGSLQAQWSGPAWFHLDLPRHLYHFPLPALKRLLVRTGFEIESEHHFSLRQNPFGWIQSFLNLHSGTPRNGLYTLLHRRGAGHAPPFDRRTRAALWAWLVVGAPVSLALTLVETALRNAATVHVVTHRASDGPPA